MTDKLEALSQPVAEFRKCYPLGIDSPPGGFFQPLPGLKNVKPGDHLYSQEYVTALLAALEEKDQQIKELEEFAKLALEKIPSEKASPDFYIVGNGPCFLAYPESMSPEARGDLAGNLRKAYLSPTHWKQRANAAEQREEHLKATVDVLSAKNAELEQRLQQPIKLPERYSVDCGVVCDPSGDWLSLDEMVKVLGDAGLEVRSPCPRCNRLLDLTSRPDGAHYCHHKVEGA